MDTAHWLLQLHVALAEAGKHPVEASEERGGEEQIAVPRQPSNAVEDDRG